MPFRIQRVPQGLLNLLSIFGGTTPQELEDRVRASIDLTQFYGLQQIRFLQETNAALAEGSAVSVLSAASGTDGLAKQWCVLFHCTGIFQKTATATALRGAMQIARQSGNYTPVASEELGPFGATETGSTDVCFVPPYPMLLVPPWDIRAALRILGTDATAVVTSQALVGVLQ